MYTKFRDDRPVLSRVILGNPEVVASPPPPLVPARVELSEYVSLLLPVLPDKL